MIQSFKRFPARLLYTLEEKMITNPNPHHDAGTRISFEVKNVGDAGGNARVGTEVDDTFVIEWQSQYLEPGRSEVGYVSLGRLSQGRHSALAYVNPGSGKADCDENSFDVE